MNIILISKQYVINMSNIDNDDNIVCDGGFSENVTILLVYLLLNSVRSNNMEVNQVKEDCCRVVVSVYGYTAAGKMIVQTNFIAKCPREYSPLPTCVVDGGRLIFLTC